MRSLPKALTTFLFTLGTLFAPVSPSVSQAPSSPFPPGKLIDLGGRRLHIHSIGKCGPSVVFESGAGDFSFDWNLVQTKVARFARSCTYDRAGYAWSEPGPMPRTMHQIAFELREGLHKAGIKGPYVLVGHSLGGLIVRIFAAQYPDEVAGVVLVDSTHEDTKLGIGKPGDPKSFKIVRFRDMTQGRAIPAVQFRMTASATASQNVNQSSGGDPPKIESPFDKLPPEIQNLRLWAMTRARWGESRGSEFDYLPEELTQLSKEREEQACPLGNKPLIVLAGARDDGPPPGAGDEEGKKLREEKLKQKQDLASLSTNSRFIIDFSSGHHIQLDDPDLVAAAIHQVVDAVRTGKPLTGTVQK